MAGAGVWKCKCVSCVHCSDQGKCKHSSISIDENGRCVKMKKLPWHKKIVKEWLEI